MSCPGALRRAPALSVLGPDALFVGSRRSLCRGPALFRHSLCRGQVFSESERVGPAVCRATRRSLTRVGARRSLRLGPALSVSGPGALCVGPRRSVCRAPAFSVSGCVGAGAFCVGAGSCLCPAPAALCQGPALSVCGT